MKTKVIIAGGTGLIGQALLPLLIMRGLQPVVLTRSPSRSAEGVIYSSWDPHTGFIDTSIFTGKYYIINLSGENIGAKRWTTAQKQRIAASRTEPALLLAQTCAQADRKPRATIAMSAVGIYGAVSVEQYFAETESPHNDFLAATCRQWEDAAHMIGTHAHRSVILRLGIVLSSAGGALPRMVQPIRLCAGMYIGTGRQYISWIHIEDLCRWIVYCIEDESIHGTFNTAAPGPVSNRDFTRALCKLLHRPFIPLGVPRWAMQLLLGEMSVIVTEGSRVNTDRIKSTGFQFMYPDLASALNAAYNR